MSENIKQNVKKAETKRGNIISLRSKPGKGFSQDKNSPVERVLHLQRTIGNRAVNRLIRSGIIHAKLTIGKPGDIYEKEADRMADRVMSMPETSLTQRKSTCPECPERKEIQAKSLVEQITPLVQRQAEEEEEVQAKQPVQQQTEDEEELQTKPLLQRQVEEEEEKPLQSRALSGQTPEVSPNIESNIDAMKGGGQPLSESTRAFFEPRFGINFSRVRVHTDSRAAQTALAINARAFTSGKNIVFGPGQYSPGTSRGKSLLAHELTHVVQQRVRIPGNALRISASYENLVQRAPSAAVIAAVAILATLVACALPFYLYAMSRYRRKSDKWRHCWVSCEMSKTCGAILTQFAGLGKEIRDRAVAVFCDYYPTNSICQGGHGDFWDSLGDLAANQYCIPWETYFVGPLARLWRQSCRECCDASGL